MSAVRSYTEAAQLVGRAVGASIAQWVARFNQVGLAAATRRPSELVALRFDLSTCGAGDDEATAETIVRLHPDGTPKRKYRRTEKSKGPRIYRSRPDPFAAVWNEVCEAA